MTQEMSRLLWADICKGLAILCVVLWHAFLWHKNATGVVPELLQPTLTLLATVRMPLFFFVSGLFARSALRQGGNRAVIRAANLVFVFAFWGLIVSAKDAALHPNELGHYLGQAVFNLLNPTGYWYLWALAVFLCLGRLLFWLGRGAEVFALALGIVLYFSAPMLNASYVAAFSPYAEETYLADSARNFVFFIGGAVLWSGFARENETYPAWRRLPILLAVVFCLPLIAGFAPGSEVRRLLISLFAVAVIVASAPLLGRTIAGRGLAFFGRRTIYIYIFHPIYLTVTGIALRELGLKLPMTPGLQEVSVLVHTLIALLLALLFEAALRRSGLTLLVTGPFAERRIAGSVLPATG